MTKTCGIALLIYLVVQARQTVGASVDEHPNPEHPPFHDQIQCYSLPYGGIGFAAHLVTLYTVLMLANRRSPCRWRPIKYKRLCQILCLVSLEMSIMMDIFNIRDCGDKMEDPVVFVAVWEVILSANFGILSFHVVNMPEKEKDVSSKDVENASCTEIEMDATDDFASKADPKNEPDAFSQVNDTASEITVVEHGTTTQVNDTASEITVVEHGTTTQEETKPQSTAKPETSSVLWWMLLYCAGAVIALSYFMRIVSHEISRNPAVKTITLVFGTFSLTCFIAISATGAWGAIEMEKRRSWHYLGITVFTMIMMGLAVTGVIGPFYSDWILAVVGQNIGGLPPPSSSAIFYWTFLVARLLPFMSI